jgi:hypothetical protein
MFGVVVGAAALAPTQKQLLDVSKTILGEK